MPVIEILVAVGDTVAVEDPLVTLESDKATMDVPSPAAGVVKAMHVKVGDKVAEGTCFSTWKCLRRSARSRLRPSSGAPAPTPTDQRAPVAKARRTPQRPLVPQDRRPRA